MDLTHLQNLVKSQTETRFIHTSVDRRLAFIGSESGELINATLKYLQGSKSIEEKEKKLNDIACEMHDVIWNVLALANYLNIDIVDAVNMKQKELEIRWEGNDY